MKRFVTTLAAVIGSACLAAPALASLPSDAGGPEVNYGADWATVAGASSAAGATSAHKTIVVYDSLTVPTGPCQPPAERSARRRSAGAFLVPAKYPRWNEKGACRARPW